MLLGWMSDIPPPRPTSCNCLHYSHLQVSGSQRTPSHPLSPLPFHHTLTNCTLAPPTPYYYWIHVNQAGHYCRSHITSATPLKSWTLHLHMTATVSSTLYTTIPLSGCGPQLPPSVLVMMCDCVAHECAVFSSSRATPADPPHASCAVHTVANYG